MDKLKRITAGLLLVGVLGGGVLAGAGGRWRQAMGAVAADS